MEIQIWIIGQIVIDIAMITLLLWFVRFVYKRSGTNSDVDVTLRKSEVILSEMKEISRALEKNLEKKKELSRHILGQLDEGLMRAEASYSQIRSLNREYSKNFTNPPTALRDADLTRSSIDALLAKGISKEEIAQHLGISIGEIDLLLKIGPKKARGTYDT